MSFSDEIEIKRSLKDQPFYNAPIKNPKIKHLNNADMLSELLFYDELNIVKTAKAFKKYARSYSIEIIKDKDGNLNDELAQLEAGKPVMKDLLRDLLKEMKGFKYQITMKVLLSKLKENGDREFTTVYFNSTAKTVIDLNNDRLNKSFQQVLYRLDTWINEGPAWIITYIDGEYVNISIYSPLSESIHIELSDELRNSMKGLVQNDDNKCFLWCHVRHLIKSIK